MINRVSETERSDRKTAGVAEWQTHQTQNLTGATSCRFSPAAGIILKAYKRSCEYHSQLLVC